MVTDHEMRMEALRLYEENILLRKVLTEIAEAIRPEWADDPVFLVDIAKEVLRRTSPLAANDGRVKCNHWPGQKRCEVCGMGTVALSQAGQQPGSDK